MKLKNLKLAIVALAWMASTLSTQAQTVKLDKLWDISTAASRDYVTTNANERGIAISPKNNHVYVVSRSGGNRIMILDGDNGSELGQLDMTDVAGGTFAVSTVAAAEDGAIYAANLVTATTDTVIFKVYRWSAEDAVPEVVYAGNPLSGLRLGDSLDVFGSGQNTLIGAGAGGGTTTARFVILSRTNATENGFSAKAFSPTGVAANDMKNGIGFASATSVIGRINGIATARLVSFDLAAGTSTLTASIPVDSGIAPIGVDAVNKIFAGINTGTHRLRVYDYGFPTEPSELASAVFPTPATANGNAVGAVDFGSGKLVAIDTQNGIIAYRVTVDNTPLPPTIATQPAAVTVLAGGSATLTVSATGTKPFTYQWLSNGVNIAGASKATLTLTGSKPDFSADYSAVVSNALGAVTSQVARLTVTPLVTSGRMERIWKLSPGERNYIAADNNHRGAAFNPVSGNVLLVSRTRGTTNIHVLDGATGADKGRLRSTGDDGVNFITGGTFPLNLVDVSDDGVVYAANLTTDGNGFTIYRWENDGTNTVPTLAYGPANPGIGRVGDTFRVRGAGTKTQILVASRSDRKFAIFETADGSTFEAKPFELTEGAAGNFGLGLAFGAGNTIWGKGDGTNVLRQFQFDVSAGTAARVSEFAPPQFAASVTAIGVLPSKNLLLGVSLENPDNARLYDLASTPALVHQELLPTDNDNINGTGFIDFIGEDRALVLDTNNGLAVYRIKDAPAALAAAAVSAGKITFTVTGAAGTYKVQKTASLETPNWTDLGDAVVPAGSSGVPFSDNVSGSAGFYRLITR